MKELVLGAKTENLDTVLETLGEELDSADCPMKTRFQLEVAVEELFVNVANYAYAPNEGDVTVRIDVSQEPAGVTVTLIDSGVPFDPLAKPDPNVANTLEDQKIGGLGIFMVKKSMDEVTYDYREGCNILTIKKLF
ncbi:MAG: ATP-binding protein [Ruminococcus sp.]|nr:ATP-binding protein [Ruminococcus sp.]